MSEKIAYHTRVSSVRVVNKVIVSRNIARSISWCDLCIMNRRVPDRMCPEEDIMKGYA